ncbi:MAG: hypothetical protein ABSB76_14330 [Streptosporangiaceae bacterium]|jgi:glyoxylase-like metal-dependent hydrolase (beta-lactamase superfamily II)
MSLDFDVFMVDPKPIPSTVPGFEEREGRELTAWVKSHGCELGYVYITHPHADHFSGYRPTFPADFEAALERSSAPVELIDRVTSAYPDLANPYTLWVAPTTFSAPGDEPQWFADNADALDGISGTGL